MAAIASSIMAFTVLVATLAIIFCRKKDEGSRLSAR